MESLYSEYMTYWKHSYEHWRSTELFSAGWFFLVIFLMVLYTVWILLADKRRLKDLLLFGSFISVSAIFIDMIAVSVGLWEYKTRVFPLNPATFPFDFTTVPIFYMLVMQYTASWRSYFTGSVIAAVLYSFVLSPIFVLLNIRQYHGFNHFYMFLLVFVVTTIIKFVFNWIDSIVRKAS